MRCPYCSQSIELTGRPAVLVKRTEEVICPACHGLGIVDHLTFTLRRARDAELAAADWEQYQAIVAELVAKWGPRKTADCPTPPRLDRSRVVIGPAVAERYRGNSERVASTLAEFVRRGQSAQRAANDAIAKAKPSLEPPKRDAEPPKKDPKR